MADFRWLAELTPERKETELRKHVDKIRAEIKQKEQEIREAEKLITEAQEEVRVLESIQIPEARPVSAEFVEITTAPKQKAEPLEEILGQATTERKKEIEQIARLPMQQIYASIREIYNEQAERRMPYDAQNERLYLLTRAFERKREDIETGEYAPTEKAEHLMTGVERMIKKMYKN